MKYIVRINDKEYEVEVERGQANLLNTREISSAPFQAPAPISPKSEPSVPEKQEVKAAVVSDPAAISAPMPGTILEIKVSVGNSVKKGDVMVVLEAMKMENEITAPSDGVIKQVYVTKGASVATGDALISMQ
ncbi:MAG: biotin/lipoyl-binding protein [Oscillospiraceae bacterium]|jgi:biotin carboxyl carrier protein|nr:biotin/lipoyl-binding protein [Oscillospiraceae bacterium]